MSASLVSAKVQVDKPDIKASGAEVHSRVQVSDSCNCFKFCLPCFGRKKKVVKQSDTDMRVAQVASRMDTDDSIVRSPASENVHRHNNQIQNVTVNVHCDHSPSQTPSNPGPLVEELDGSSAPRLLAPPGSRISRGSDSSETSVR